MTDRHTHTEAVAGRYERGDYTDDQLIAALASAVEHDPPAVDPLLRWLTKQAPDKAGIYRFQIEMARDEQ